MEITVSIPDQFILTSAPASTLSREMLEAYAIENYRQEKMSLGRVAELLGLSIDETHAFFKEHAVPLNYDMDDMARDLRTIEMFLKK